MMETSNRATTTESTYAASPELPALGIRTITRITGKPLAAALAEHNGATPTVMRNMVSRRTR